MKRGVAVLRVVAITLAGATAVAHASNVLSGREPRQIDISQSAGPQTEASIAVDPLHPNVLVAASQNPYACAIRVYGSSDGGNTWTSALLNSPDAAASLKLRGRQPICAANQWVGIDRTGHQYVVFLAVVADLAPTPTLLVASRQNATSSWSTPMPVDPSNPGTADKPMLAIDNSPSSPHSGRIYDAWTRGESPQEIVISHSDDQGATWSPAVALGGGWGVHLAINSAGSVVASWWTIAGTIVIAHSSDGGHSFTRPRAFVTFPHAVRLGVTIVPSDPSEPVHPDPSLDIDRSSSRYRGRAYAVESRPTADGRRVYLTAFGTSDKPLFTTVIDPSRQGRDDFNATVAVDDSNGNIWTCFYRTGAARRRVLATYSCTVSRDGGRTWSTPVAAASVPSNESVPGSFVTLSGVDSGFASYEGLAVANEVAHPIWTDTRNLKSSGEEIYTTRLTRASVRG